MKYKVVTCCDFGEAGRKDVIRRHKNWTTARRQYKRIARIYNKIWGWRCWQEEAQHGS